jgi:drug/metabolite transporter (DMT)-like permease
MWFILASASAICSAAAAIVQKRVLFRMHALAFSFVVSLAVLACSLFVPFTTDITALSSSTLLILIVKSFLGGGAFLFVMLSLEHNPISSALPLLGLSPAVTAVLGLVVLGESLRPMEWAGLGLMVVGASVLESRPTEAPWRTLRSITFTRSHGYIFAALALFAISSVADRYLLTGHRSDPLVVLFYQHLVYVGMFGGMLLLRRRKALGIARSARGQILWILAVAVLTLVYRFTQLEATKLAPVALVLAVKRTSILYATVLGGQLFHEERRWSRLVGAMLIVAAGFLILRNAG